MLQKRSIEELHYSLAIYGTSRKKVRLMNVRQNDNGHMDIFADIYV